MKTIDVNGMAKKLCSTKGSIYAQVSKRDIPRWCIVKRGQRILLYKFVLSGAAIGTYSRTNLPSLS